MKLHSSEYKTEVKEFGREIDSKITYTINGEQIELGVEELNSVTPAFKSSILKSTMKELIIDSNVEIPVETIINYKFGVKVSTEFEYLDFGNYIVYSSKKQEDTDSYRIKCYDFMLRAMTEYNGIQTGAFPMTVRDFLRCLCNDLSLEFASENNIFANYNRMIAGDIYAGQNYTYRDIFDELAQVTASTICINDDDKLEIRYITNTNDEIDEEYLKDVNVNFGEKYGPINSIVLSRAGGGDNVYLQDTQSIEENGLHELKISDNQIMGGNDRSDYLPDILSKLNGLEYYINDFSSTGITYYDLCDRYSVKIGDNVYSCVMFNDEINVTQGLEELVYTEMPEESETDYTKADKTDRKINQTYILVDKQNQAIESVVSNVDSQNDKISRITQTVDELNSKISDVANITISKETFNATVDLEKINESEPILIKVHPILENIEYYYPSDDIFPSDTLFMKSRTLLFKNTETNELFSYEIPYDLYYLDAETYDEFVLGYDNKTCQVIKRTEYNSEGVLVKLAEERIINIEPYPTIRLTAGDYTISLGGYNTGYIYASLMAQNIYTTQFATKAEVTSEIQQTASSINLRVDEKLDSKDFTHASIVLKINDDTSQAQIEADKISLQGKTIDLTSDRVNINSTNFKVDTSGNVTANSFTSNNANITGGSLRLQGDENLTKININNGPNQNLNLASGRITMNSTRGEIDIICNSSASEPVIHVGNETEIWGSGIYTSFVQADDVFYNRLTPISLVEEKKNFEKFENALPIIMGTDIYKFNYKDETDWAKKHIGFVIGKNYKYSKELTAESKGEERGADLYSVASVCMQAIKEQQEMIKQLKEEIKMLKENR